MADYGLKVFPDAQDDTAAEFLMSTKYPFAKLDSQNENSLKTTTITFISEPPQNEITEITRYAHGYEEYTPQFWTLWNYRSAPPNATSVQTYSNVNTATASTNAFNSINFFVGVDETNVYIYISVVANGGVPPAVTVTGTVISVTVYAFVDELLLA